MEASHGGGQGQQAGRGGGARGARQYNGRVDGQHPQLPAAFGIPHAPFRAPAWQGRVDGYASMYFSASELREIADLRLRFDAGEVGAVTVSPMRAMTRDKVLRFIRALTFYDLAYATMGLQWRALGAIAEDPDPKVRQRTAFAILQNCIGRIEKIDNPAQRASSPVDDLNTFVEHLWKGAGQAEALVLTGFQRSERATLTLQDRAANAQNAAQNEHVIVCDDSVNNRLSWPVRYGVKTEGDARRQKLTGSVDCDVGRLLLLLDDTRSPQGALGEEVVVSPRALVGVFGSPPRDVDAEIERAADRGMIEFWGRAKLPFDPEIHIEKPDALGRRLWKRGGVYGETKIMWQNVLREIPALPTDPGAPREDRARNAAAFEMRHLLNRRTAVAARALDVLVHTKGQNAPAPGMRRDFLAPKGLYVFRMPTGDITTDISTDGELETLFSVLWRKRADLFPVPA